MLVFPNCKINIGLRVTGKRNDGYHDLETIFFPVPWKEALEIIESPQLSLSFSGLNIPGNQNQNLCLKAWHLLKTDFPDLPPVNIFLHKTIPTGAGLGGGSSNGSFMLTLLNQKFGLGLTESRLIEYALQLGSDCPFFILNKPVAARGRGERMHPVSIDLSGYFLVLVNPRIHVSTAWAFSRLYPRQPDKSLEELVSLPISGWNDAGVVNDFQKPVSEKHPEIPEIIETLKNAGALYAAMSGSGSTCFGIFQTPPPDNSLAFSPAFLVRKFAL